MRYEVRMTAFDMLDQVHVALVILQTHRDGSPVSSVLDARTTTVRGTGESDPLQWTRDALVAALECI